VVHPAASSGNCYVGGERPRGFAGVAEDERAGASADGTITRLALAPSYLDEAWLVVAAATPDVNRQVAEAAESRRVFVNAVDDPANATAFLSGVIRREGVTLAISTSGEAPGLTALLRQGSTNCSRRDSRMGSGFAGSAGVEAGRCHGQSAAIAQALNGGRPRGLRPSNVSDVSAGL
jgi:hypothetical protein